MLRIVNLEELQRLLLRIPALIDLQEQREPNFVPEVKQWLSQLEHVLQSNHLSAAGSVATLRGLLLSAEQGVIPNDIQFHGRASKRKIREAAAAYVVQQASHLVSSVIQPDHTRVIEAERLMRQLVSLAKAKGLIHELPAGGNFTESLTVMWRQMSADTELSPGTMSVEGLLGPSDALLVLDRILTLDASLQ